MAVQRNSEGPTGKGGRVTGSQAPKAAQGRERVPEVWGRRVPQRNMNFTGRDDLLAQLRARMETEVTAVLPHALHGLGGVGKTQVAIEYAYRYRSEYDLVWWIPADQALLVPSSLAALAPHLGLPSATATGIEEAAAAVLNALRRGEPYAKWLLIFDNADQPEDINDLIPRGPGHVLITSRNQRWQSVVDTMAVDVFSRAESVEFLHTRVPKAISEADAELLAAQLGDLPLALEQAGALQAETGISVEDYVSLLNEHASDVLAESKPSEYPVSMTAAWRISVSKLNERQPEAVELLRCCAFFGPEPIPRDVFRRGISATRPQLSMILANPILLTRVIRELGRFALARIDAVSRTVQVHRLVQALLRDDLPPDEQEQFRHEVHLLLAGAAPVDPENESNWPRYAELVAHINPAQVEQCQDPSVRRFALSIVRYLYQTGDYKSSRSFAERFIECWTADSGADDADVLVARRRLGNALRELGDYRSAYEVNSTTLERATQVLGPEHADTLQIMNSFGADLRARGEFAAAREHDEESRRRHEAVFGPADPRTLRAMNNLALDYGLISDYRAARDLHQLTFMRQSGAASGVSKVDVLITWNGLARAVRLSGEFAEARDFGADAHEFGRQELGAEHLVTLKTAKDLSIALRRTGAYAEALDLARDVCERCERHFGKDHPDSLAAAMSLANALRMTHKIDEAFDLASDTTTRYPRVYGEDHPYTRGCAGNLALLRRLRGDVTGARDLNEASLAGLDAKLGRDHHYSLTVATNLASDLSALGETKAARELGEDTLGRLRTLLGEDNPMTLGCAANLTIDLRADGAEEEAVRLAEDTLNRYARTLGPDHPESKTAGNSQRLDFDFDPPPI